MPKSKISQSTPSDSYPIRRPNDGINTDRESNRGSSIWPETKRTYDDWVDSKTGRQVPKPDYAD